MIQDSERLQYMARIFERILDAANRSPSVAAALRLDSKICFWQIFEGSRFTYDITLGWFSTDGNDMIVRLATRNIRFLRSFLAHYMTNDEILENPGLSLCRVPVDPDEETILRQYTNNDELIDKLLLKAQVDYGE